MNGDIKIGKLLCDEDIITKRQLNKALQAQIKGDKNTLGEILVKMNFCSLDDITEVILKQDELKEQHKEPEPEPIPEPNPLHHQLLNQNLLLKNQRKKNQLNYQRIRF